MNFLRAFVIFMLVGMSASQVCAITERLDDSDSPRRSVKSSPMLSEHGKPLDQENVLGPLPTVGIVKFESIEYKLKTSKYLGKHARIYFVIPPYIPGLRKPTGLWVDWRSTGLFASGSAQPGQRYLVWNGLINTPYITDRLALTMRIDLRELQTQPGVGLSFESYFEIEVSP